MTQGGVAPASLNQSTHQAGQQSTHQPGQQSVHQAVQVGNTY